MQIASCLDSKAGIAAAGRYQVNGGIHCLAEIGRKQQLSHGEVISNGQYNILQAGVEGLFEHGKHGAMRPIRQPIDIRAGRMIEKRMTGLFLPDKEDQIYRVPYGIIYNLFFRKDGLSIYFKRYGRIRKEWVTLTYRGF